MLITPNRQRLFFVFFTIFIVVAFTLRAADLPVQSAPVGAKPPPGAIVLFDGHNLDAWAKQKERQWLTEDGPANHWKLLEGEAVEVVPGTGCIISKKEFGDCKVHLEFKILGPVNSGLFLQTRYEVNIKDSYGQAKGEPCCAPGNFSGPGLPETITNAAAPPLQWQSLDIYFRAPRFDGAEKKTANARVTAVFNGTTLYKEVEVETIKGAAKRLGEAPKGPLMLQEHGAPIQFRNIWLVEGESR